MEDMVNIMKKIRILVVVALMSFVMLLGCKHEETSSAVPNEIAVGGSIYDKYGLGVEVDLSEVFVTIIYSDNKEKQYSALSKMVSYDEFDTSTEGNKVSIFKCEGLSYEFNYEVVKYCLTLDFLDGTYNEASSLSIDAYNNRVVFSNIIPTANDSQKQFAGWFYDRDLTRRVVTDIDNECRIDDNTTFYAGYDINYDDNFEYLIKDDTVILTSYKLSFDYDDTITIPKTIKLYPVVEIGDSFVDETTSSVAFWIEKLNFMEDSAVKKIGVSAFENLTLAEINLPDSIEIIDDRAFYNNQFTSIKLPKSLRKIGSSAFAFSSELLTVDFNDCALITIDDNAFKGCNKLVDIKLPKNVESIGSSAFEGCSRVREFTIPKSVSIIGVNVFSNMPDLQKIDVEEGNLKFSTINGNLYNNDQTIFYRYCYGKTETSFVLPTTVKIIFESAFDIKNEKCYLNNVVLNEGIEEIASRAFQNTTFDFTIPSTVKSIADDSFVNWGGTTFKVNESNPKFKVVNSSLVSYDESILYAVPANYNDEIYVVPDSIKTINSYAMTSLNNVNVIKISSDSKLENIKEYGVTPFGLNSLIAIIIDKEVPFNIVDNGFKKTEDIALNNSFSVVISNQAINNYLNAWADYHFYLDDVPLTNYVKSIDSFLQELVIEINDKLNVTSYEGYKKNRIFMLDDNFNESFFNGRDVLKKINTIFYFDAMAYSDYDDYFTALINGYTKYVLDYYSSLSLKDLGNAKYSFRYLDALFSSQISLKLTNENKELIAETRNRYNELESNRNKVIDKLINYELSSTKFDIDSYNDFMADYDKYNVGNMTISNNELFKYYMIDFSYKMYLLTTLDYNYQNAAYLYDLLNGNMFENIYGINDYLLYYFNQDAYTINLYMYSSLDMVKNNVNELISEMCLFIDNEFSSLDITASYDETKYQELLDLYGNTINFDYLLGFETKSIYQFVRLRMYVNEFIDYKKQGFSKANIYDVTILSNNISAILRDPTLSEQIEACSEYSSYEEAYNSYVDFFNETCNEFNSLVFDIDSENIMDKFADFLSLYQEYPEFISILMFESNDEWFLMQTKVDAIICAKKINDIIILANDNDITVENYKDIFNLYYGYYNEEHIDGVEEILNRYAFDSDFSNFLNDYIDSNMNLKYQNIINQL